MEKNPPPVIFKAGKLNVDLDMVPDMSMGGNRGKLVTVAVGPERRLYEVHLQYLGPILSKRLLEFDQEIQLPDDNPKVFNLFMNWQYNQGKIPRVHELFGCVPYFEPLSYSEGPPGAIQSFNHICFREPWKQFSADELRVDYEGRFSVPSRLPSSTKETSPPNNVENATVGSPSQELSVATRSSDAKTSTHEPTWRVKKEDEKEPGPIPGAFPAPDKSSLVSERISTHFRNMALFSAAPAPAPAPAPIPAPIPAPPAKAPAPAFSAKGPGTGSSGRAESAGGANAAAAHGSEPARPPILYGITEKAQEIQDLLFELVLMAEKYDIKALFNHALDAYRAGERWFARARPSTAHVLAFRGSRRRHPDRFAAEASSLAVRFVHDYAFYLGYRGGFVRELVALFDDARFERAMWERVDGAVEVPGYLRRGRAAVPGGRGPLDPNIAAYRYRVD